MKIDKAIELLTHWQNGGDITSFDDVNTAVRLGIEAMKHLKECWEARECERIWLLPGETEE